MSVANNKDADQPAHIDVKSDLRHYFLLLREYNVYASFTFLRFRLVSEAERASKSPCLVVKPKTYFLLLWLTHINKAVVFDQRW